MKGGVVYTCKECGTQHDDSRYQKNCHTCSFWLRHVESRDEPESIRYNNTHFRLGEKRPNIPDSCKGFNGRHFIIHFNDGRIVHTDNLWCQGRIPDRFLERLPTNAEIIGLDTAFGREGFRYFTKEG